MEKTKNYIKETISIVIMLIAIWLFKAYIASPIKVNGDSMNDTLYDKDIMILDEISYKFNDIKRFDIVVVKRNQYLIKRIIGLPGDVVEYKDNTLYINGKKLEEKFAHKQTNDFKVKVPEGHYFVLGDNRTNSSDSRIIGSIPRDEIIGKAELIIFPFNRFGIVE